MGTLRESWSHQIVEPVLALSKSSVWLQYMPPLSSPAPVLMFAKSRKLQTIQSSLKTRCRVPRFQDFA